MKNFHLPLADELHAQIMHAAHVEQEPATELVRRVIREWLADWARRDRHRAISEYARRAAGTPEDLDRALESASVDLLLREAERQP